MVEPNVAPLGHGRIDAEAEVTAKWTETLEDGPVAQRPASNRSSPPVAISFGLAVFLA